ncbi:MAG: hypothetical protein JOZ59_00245 [Candidatus Eremiobacteraeota bacterium]|nr:hypothetical protein [Candidatus Eremiobacteraeota bacterium]
MMILATAALLLSSAQIAQAPTVAQTVDTRGPCLDSPKSVPNVLGDPFERSSEIVRIDKVVSTRTMMANEVIGFVYTRQDGKTYLGTRSAQYTSPGSAAQLNAVLASTHAPDVKETAFPPQSRLGVKTSGPPFLGVHIPPNAMEPLGIRLDPCVSWPTASALPDPT